MFYLSYVPRFLFGAHENRLGNVTLTNDPTTVAEHVDAVKDHEMKYTVFHR